MSHIVQKRLNMDIFFFIVYLYFPDCFDPFVVIGNNFEVLYEVRGNVAGRLVHPMGEKTLFVHYQSNVRAKSPEVVKQLRLGGSGGRGAVKQIFQ